TGRGGGGQLWFAARLVAGVLDYKAQLERRCPEEPWLQAAFGGCRVPGPRREEVLRVPPGAQCPQHITVIRNGQFFELQALGEEGLPLSPAELGVALGVARARAGRGGATPLGLLTGLDRRGWGRSYGRLMRDRLNRASIGQIQRSLFALSLDTPVLATPGGRGPAGVAGQVLHGGGAGANSANRWFDKSLQFIVGGDGTCGVVYDPALIDAAAVAEMVDHALSFCRQQEPGPAPVTSLAHPQRLRFSLGPEIAPEVERAKKHLDSLAADVDFDCFWHEGVAGAGLPPEALLQVALQVAFYRAHGSLCASCEPTSLRRVLPGATDLLRPPGPPCLALATALDTPHTEPQVLLSLLREAVEAEAQNRERGGCGSEGWAWLRRVGVAYVKGVGVASGWVYLKGGAWPAQRPCWALRCCRGRAPERHLQGLRQAALAGGEPLPPIFTDPAYAQANHFRLCTLQVQSREGCWLLRGPLVPDGYGVGVAHLPPRDPPRDPLAGGGAAGGHLQLLLLQPDRGCPPWGGALRGVLDQLGGLLKLHPLPAPHPETPPPPANPRPLGPPPQRQPPPSPLQDPNPSPLGDSQDPPQTP
ncbi:LOW QUALITY PROTEIN: carnitine O-acetyltransferase-like, partial [Melanerpes formicivorus]|uniref:LOW QUALITY PROTEIN: carnitine O-acetyltransferase-like n=1 Tax=Melanerpes formicivorus TaxID=211600 RepID=UPI00358DE20E